MERNGRLGAGGRPSASGRPGADGRPGVGRRPAPYQATPVPMRPLTIGELLDAAVALLRTRARTLLVTGLLLAAAEQVALRPLRDAAQLRTDYIPVEGRVVQWWVLMGTGFGTEAFIIAILGGLAGAGALPALVGRPVPRPLRRRLATATAVGVVAVVAGIACGLGAAAFALPWLILYPLLGLAAPIAVVDRLGPGRALLRSMGLVLRSGLRPGFIRLVGYLGWLLFRLALGIGGVALLGLVPGFDSGPWEDVLSAVAWLLVNAIAYPMLGCLDAVLHLETRMRVEGLDIALGRALRRGESLEPWLAVPRA